MFSPLYFKHPLSGPTSIFTLTGGRNVFPTSSPPCSAHLINICRKTKNQKPSLIFVLSIFLSSFLMNNGGKKKDKDKNKIVKHNAVKIRRFFCDLRANFSWVRHIPVLFYSLLRLMRKNKDLPI